MLWRHVSLWMELKAFDASIKRAASVSSFSNVSLIAWIAASHPPFMPQHTWSVPAAFWMSFCRTFPTALAQTRRMVSPIPIGLTSFAPFSSGTRRPATKVVSASGSTNSVQSRLAKSATVSQSSWLVFCALLEQARRRQSSASRPEGPAAPWDLREIDLIRSASICS